jgi:hypothetical protein
MHLRATGSFADSSRVVGIIFAAFALKSVGRYEVGCNDAGIQSQYNQFACPMVGAGAGLHGDQATGRVTGRTRL